MAGQSLWTFRSWARNRHLLRNISAERGISIPQQEAHPGLSKVLLTGEGGAETTYLPISSPQETNGYLLLSGEYSLQSHSF